MTTPIPAGWKPIESAPKDGTPVLLFARHIDAEASTRVVGWFNADYGWIAQSYVGQPFARLIPSQWAELLPFPGSPASVAQGDAQTPGAAWRAKGEPDPHGDRYACERAALTMGNLTDDELANGAFMNYDRGLDVEALMTKRPGYFPPIAWMTAVKDRIRWLSRKLEEAKAAPAAGDARDGARLDWMIQQQAWIWWTKRDSSIDQCQVWCQIEDENYIVLSGDHRFFNTPREAIDAAIAAQRGQGGE